MSRKLRLDVHLLTKGLAKSRQEAQQIIRAGKVRDEFGKILDKPGSGFSLGSGLIVTTPVGPLRLEAASQGFDGEWRFNLGVGWKF